MLLFSRTVAEADLSAQSPGSNREQVVGRFGRGPRELARRREQDGILGRRRGRRSLGEAVLFEEVDGHLPGLEGGVIRDASQERQVRRDPKDLVVPERPTEPHDGLLPV
jgi:hypothetical protein